MGGRRRGEVGTEARRALLRWGAGAGHGPGMADGAPSAAQAPGIVCAGPCAAWSSCRAFPRHGHWDCLASGPRGQRSTVQAASPGWASGAPDASLPCAGQDSRAPPKARAKGQRPTLGRALCRERALGASSQRPLLLLLRIWRCAWSSSRPGGGCGGQKGAACAQPRVTGRPCRT